VYIYIYTDTHIGSYYVSRVTLNTRNIEVPANGTGDRAFLQGDIKVVAG
jgi:hypothetical protein